jgi:phosphoserine phosphatase RsbU/P
VTEKHARSRFERLAARFDPKPRAARALEQSYWANVRELFTRDLTQEGLKELLNREAQDTFRFFTREVLFDDLRERPWYRRWPKACWRTFLAMAYRLTPWRRILFAVAVPLLSLAWLNYLFRAMGGDMLNLPPLTLVGGTALFFLLALELRDKLSLKGDLEVARQIQFGLLPFEPFLQDGLEIRTAMRPANTVGGDYFDVVEIGTGRLAVVMGDVAGKGMPAALLMALLQGSLRTLLVAGFRGEELLRKLNAHLIANIPANRLVTFFYGELETATGALAYVNAGHNPPFLLRPGEPACPLPATGPALGILEAASFDKERTRLAPGDRLFLYTDGVTEAENAGDEAYGEERLLAYLDGHRGESGQDVVDGVVQDVLAFCGSTRTRDDMTLMCVSRAGPPPE